jgi:hypothetical protein
MSERNLIDFLRTVAARADLLGALEWLDKGAVIEVATAVGLEFSEAEFDRLVWALEEHLANRRGDTFDGHFALWETMWGQSYLSYLVKDVITSLTQSDIDTVIGAVTATDARAQ